MFYDLQTKIDEKGNYDISFDEENNNTSLVINAILKKLRIDFDANKGEKINEKYGCVGDTLFLEEKYITGSLLWNILKEKNGNNIKDYIEIEINSVLKNLKDINLITDYKIKNILVDLRNIQIYLIVNNSQINLFFS